MLHDVLSFLVALGVLITVHEYGHFWAARRCGVRILRFSIGFGRPLFMRRFGPDRTEFVVAAVPLGGYVRMLDEREGEVAAEDLPRAFNRQPLSARAFVVAAGPAANFLLAIVAFWCMYMVGVTDLAPIVGKVETDTIAAEAGLRAGDRIEAVDGRKTPTWGSVSQAALAAIVEQRAVELEVQSPGGTRTLRLDLARVHVDEIAQGSLFERMGMMPQRPYLPAVIGEVLPASAAERAGLRAGDRVLSADGRPVEDWNDWVDYVRARAQQAIRIEVERAGARVPLDVVPERAEGGIGRIGAAVERPEHIEPLQTGVERYGPLAAVGPALHKTWEMSAMTVRLIWRMLRGDASVRNLSGPISIAQFAGDSASIGASAFAFFIGTVSVSLFVLNLLPVPILDGGHLLYYLIELVRRRPLSEASQAWGQQVGLVVLVGLMGLAFYNDILRLIGRF
ncbi:MAG: RIP metalloprotease RseP [Gammaproteobacteria bacterium]